MWLIIAKIFGSILLFLALAKWVSSYIKIGDKSTAWVKSGIAWEEDRKKYREELLLYVIFSSLSLAFGIWFAFWKIVDALGFYPYIATSLEIIFFSSIAIGMALHNYWSYDSEEIFREIARD